MIEDRLHILDRISTSLNIDDVKSVTDFSDAKSIKERRISYQNKNKFDNSTFLTQSKPVDHYSSYDDNRNDFQQYQNFDLHDGHISHTTIKAKKNDPYHLSSTVDRTHSKLPNLRYNSNTQISRNNLREVKAKSVLKQGFYLSQI